MFTLNLTLKSIIMNIIHYYEYNATNTMQWSDVINDNQININMAII